MTLPGIRLSPVSRRGWRSLSGLPGPLLLLAAASCSPYDRYIGEVNAGAVDPSKFPTAYLGDDADPKQAGTGKFHPIVAKVNGQQVGYYRFPLPAAQARAPDPLVVSALSPALAYLFDPPVSGAYPATYRCRVPAERELRPENCPRSTSDSPYVTPPDPCPGYRFDPRVDAFRYDVQNPIVTALPDSAGYIPIVNEVPVTTNDLVCQSVKSEDTLLETPGVKVPVLPPAPGTFMGKSRGWPSGRYFAWALIDPAAEVLTLNDKGQEVGEYDRDRSKGFGPQRFGWWNKFMVAYLDGGQIPRQILADKDQVKLRAQRLYYPTAVAELDDKGNKIGVLDGEPFVGNDLLEGARGSDAYSPLCQVFSYDSADPMDPMDPNKLRIVDSAAKIDPATMKVTDTKTLVYCLQLQ